MWNEQFIEMFSKGIVESFYMIIASSVVAYLIGLPLGILLVISDKEGIRPQKAMNKVLGLIVNLVRSIPFIILLILILPVTKFITGTVIGPKAIIVPLIFSSAPYIARLVESSLKEVDKGVIEAAQSMGASPMQIIFKVLIPEAKPSLINGGAIAIITILGYSAMAGFVGAGGVGSIAINYGYYRNQTDVGLVAVIILVLMVQVIQEIGNWSMRRNDKRLS